MSAYQRYTNQLLEIKNLLAQAKDEEVIERLRDLAQGAVDYLEVPFEYTDGNGNSDELEYENSYNTSGCSYDTSGC